MEKRANYNSIFSIVPPHILRAIAQNGEPEQRRRALHTLAHDQTLRTLRVTRDVFTEMQVRSRAWLSMDQKIHRTIYNADHTTNLPGNIVRVEGSEPGNDPTVNEAYDGLGWTDHFYREVFGRNSIDDQGMPLDAVIHYSMNYDNAFFNGEFMVFGDGDNEIFNRFTVSLDIIGHELTHGVTASEAGLDYVSQAGALNESISDVFGSLIKQFSRNQDAVQADWLIGQGLFTAKVQGQALRSMKEPGTAFHDSVLGKDPQPAHMNNYVYTAEDNGGVHINSGIPNLAFYKVATKIGGKAWNQPGRIWYETLRDSRLRPTANFQAFARLTLDNAESIYGRDSRERVAVQEAWEEVGVLRVAALV